MLLLIKRASNCNLGSQYLDYDLGRSTLSRCFLYINMHSDQGRSVFLVQFFQALHAACHKDFMRSLNVKSTLTNPHHSLFPEAVVHASALHWV